MNSASPSLRVSVSTWCPPPYAHPTPCPVLTSRMVLPGHYGQRDTVAADCAGMSLCACYAMPGTDTARGAIGLRPCYAMPGTDTERGAIGLRACYAMPGTDVASGATRPGCYPVR
eukprot:3931374-Rhodomonas_salina.2